METIIIGNQEWSVNNLNVDSFYNGDLIQEIKSREDWIEAAQEKVPAYCYYNNDASNGNIYGRLYNWYAAVDGRGINTNGFRIPTKMDIEDLIINLTGGHRSREMIREKGVAGKDLKKNISEWETPKISKSKLKRSLKFIKSEIDYLEINELKCGYGFNALPGGQRKALRLRDFREILNLATFWCSTPDDYKYSEEQITFGIEEKAYCFSLNYFSSLGLSKDPVQFGKSIRLMRNI